MPTASPAIRALIDVEVARVLLVHTIAEADHVDVLLHNGIRETGAAREETACSGRARHPTARDPGDRCGARGDGLRRPWARYP